MPLTLKNELDQLKEKQFYRSLSDVDSQDGSRIQVGGEWLLNFASNDYLGLTRDARLAKAALSAVKKWGTGSGASRLLSGNLKIHVELENKLAAFKKEEATLVFSSGYLANLGVI